MFPFPEDPFLGSNDEENRASCCRDFLKILKIYKNATQTLINEFTSAWWHLFPELFSRNILCDSLGSAPVLKPFQLFLMNIFRGLQSGTNDATNAL